MPPSAFSASEVAAMAKWLGEQGERVTLTVQADGTPLGLTLAQTINRTADVIGAVSTMPHVTIEICNEPEASDKNLPPGVNVWQIVDALGLRRATNRPVLMASGAYVIVGYENEFDGLDIVTDHGERKPDWPGEAGKLGHFVYDGWDDDVTGSHWKGFSGRDVHVWEDEPMGCATVPSGSRDNNPDNFEDAGGGYAMGCGSLTFHSTNGLQALPFDETELECARRWNAAADFFPADAPLGKYTHQDMASFPFTSDNRCSEAAGRIMGPHLAYVVVAQPTGWNGQPRDGWRVTRTGGRGFLFELQR